MNIRQYYKTRYKYFAILMIEELGRFNPIEWIYLFREESPNAQEKNGSVRLSMMIRPNVLIDYSIRNIFVN